MCYSFEKKKKGFLSREEEPDRSFLCSPHLPSSILVLFFSSSFTFLLTLPQSYIKAWQPLEEHIKVFRRLKSYKLSALQYHYMSYFDQRHHPASLLLFLCT